MNKATRVVQSKYDRIAPAYDLMESLHEIRMVSWRQCAWKLVRGPNILEIGVGTGRNINHYPPDAQITAIDISPKMLARAQQHALKREQTVNLIQMDAQALDFANHNFDTVIATCAFCSVPDPVLGLQEVRRVLKPGGRIVLLEHTRSNIPLLGHLMDMLDPVVSGLMGPHINRNTVENVHLAGLKIITALNLDPWGIFKLIVGRA